MMRLETRDEFTTSVIRTINDLCKLVFNVHSEQDIEKVFGISNEKLAVIIRKITASMPAQIFELSAARIEEIKNIFAKEFIFFQVQEKLTDPNYEHDLANFIYAFSRDIQNKFVVLAKEEK